MMPWWWRLRQEAPAILVVVGLIVVAVLWTAFATSRMEEPAQRVTGTVVRFGTAHDYEGNRPIVIVRMGDGTDHQLPVSPSTLNGCRSGDPIEIFESGGLRRVGPAGCRDSGATGPSL